MKPLGHMKVLTRAGCVASVVVCLAGCCLPTSPPGRFRGLLPPDARCVSLPGLYILHLTSSYRALMPASSDVACFFHASCRHLCVQGKEGGSAPHGAVMDEQFYHFFSLIARGVPCVEAGPASGLQERHAQRLCAEEKGRGVSWAGAGPVIGHPNTALQHTDGGRLCCMCVQAPSEALTQAVIRFFEAFRGASIRQCSRQTGASPGQVVAVMTAHGLGPPSTSAHTVSTVLA